jgi:hypothetical protein
MNRPATLGALRASGYPDVPVKEEMRRNLVRMLRNRDVLFPGIIGYEKTVLPQLVNAVLSRHDFILLGAHPPQPRPLPRRVHSGPRRHGNERPPVSPGVGGGAAARGGTGE